MELNRLLDLLVLKHRNDFCSFFYFFSSDHLDPYIELINRHVVMDRHGPLTKLLSTLTS